jgi:hypothetical protein
MNVHHAAMHITPDLLKALVSMLNLDICGWLARQGGGWSFRKKA